MKFVTHHSVPGAQAAPGGTSGGLGVGPVTIP
jgi:hypothetical protein